MIIDRYEKPSSVESAYDLFSSTANSVVVGGGAYIRLGKKHADLAIDLCNAGLNFINEKDNTIEIGATTTFRQLEKSEILENYYGGVISSTVKIIMGVQMRNIVTVGGSIYGKYGFSDLITTLLALDCKVVLHKRGEVSLELFLKEKLSDKDILEKIIIEKDGRCASFQTMRNTSTDFSMLNVSICKINNSFRIAVGARPGIASLAPKAMAYMESSKVDKGDQGDLGDQDDFITAGEIASKELIFGQDLRASSEYRKELCIVLVKRGLMEVAK